MSSNRIENKSGLVDKPAGWSAEESIGQARRSGGAGCNIISGSKDRTIRIWDAETGTAVGDPLYGHIGSVFSVAYSPNGRHIISGSFDSTIRIWDAETGTAIGDLLYGHTESVSSVPFSPNERYIVSGSDDITVRTWDAEAGTAAGKLLKGNTYSVQSIAHAPDRQRIVSGSSDNPASTWDALPSLSIQPSSCNPIHPGFCAKPDIGGWVRGSEGGLLYWVPHDCRMGVHSPALLTIPLSSPIRSVSLDFSDFAFGTSWTQIYKNAPS